jgi:hypothetical protein
MTQEKQDYHLWCFKKLLIHILTEIMAMYGGNQWPTYSRAFRLSAFRNKEHYS